MKQNPMHVMALSLTLVLSLGAAVALAEPNGNPLVEQATKAFERGDVITALRQYSEAAKNDPNMSPPELWLARAQFAAGHDKLGREMLETALTKYDNYPECYLTNAKIASSEGRRTDAVLNLQAALRLANLPRWNAAERSSFRKEANAGLAMAYERRGDWDAARKHLEAWVNDDLANAGLHVRLAQALFMTDKVADAHSALKEAVRLEPELGQPEVFMAQFQSQKIDPTMDEKEKLANDKKVEEWFQKAMELYPGKARPCIFYAGWLKDKGRIVDARSVLTLCKKLEATAVDESNLTGLKQLLDKYCGMRFSAADGFLPPLKAIEFFDYGKLGPGRGGLISDDDRLRVGRITKIAETAMLPNEGPFDIWLLPKDGIPVHVVGGVKMKVGVEKQIKLDDYLGIVNVRGDNQPRAALITIAPQDDPGPGEKGHKPIQTSKEYRVDMVVPAGDYSLWITPENGARPRKIKDRFRVQAGKTVRLD
jgi:tetratricopeptide (TPR) repeat protein